jgi:hypothetical protein
MRSSARLKLLDMSPAPSLFLGVFETFSGLCGAVKAMTLRLCLIFESSSRSTFLIEHVFFARLPRCTERARKWLPGLELALASGAPWPDCRP